MAQLEVFARTEVGCARERNEDAFLILHLATGQSGIGPQQRVCDLRIPGTLLAICDGMGGAAAGDVASRMAIEAIEKVARTHGVGSIDDAESLLLASVTEANRAIGEFTRRHKDKRGMGTTFTAALALGPELVIAQVGDSRAYLKRGRVLQQLTMDQNVVGQMIAAGKLRPEDARNFKQRNVLLEAIGVQERVGPDIVRVRVRAGDTLMLCSDGLTACIGDQEIADTLSVGAKPEAVNRQFIAAALEAGAPDNVSVISVFARQG